MTMHCRHHPSGHSDDARRVADTTKLAWVVYGYEGYVNRWMAFKLQDGTSDNAMYPSKLDAMQHCSNHYRYMFCHMSTHGGMSDCEAEIMLTLHRRARDRDIATPQLHLPHGGPDIIPRIGHDKVTNQIRALRKAGG
jgi:hypothetical protein